MQRIKIRGCAVFASDRRWDAEVFPTPGDAARFVAEHYATELVDVSCPPKPEVSPPKSPRRPKFRGSCLEDYWPGARTETKAS